jgi:hypothetical protein
MALNDEYDVSTATGGGRYTWDDVRWVLHYCHLWRHPQSDTLPDQAKPYRYIILFGAVEIGHRLTKATGMDKKGRGSCSRMILQWFVLV